jgi:hypothetical protein
MCNTRADLENRCTYSHQTSIDPETLLLAPCPEGSRLRELTPFFGKVDALVAVGLLIAALLFERWWVPRIVAENLVEGATAAEFAVRVDLLPRFLEDQHLEEVIIFSNRGWYSFVTTV